MRDLGVRRDRCLTHVTIAESHLQSAAPRCELCQFFTYIAQLSNGDTSPSTWQPAPSLPRSYSNPNPNPNLTPIPFLAGQFLVEPFLTLVQRRHCSSSLLVASCLVWSGLVWSIRAVTSCNQIEFRYRLRLVFVGADAREIICCVGQGCTAPLTLASESDKVHLCMEIW